MNIAEQLFYRVLAGEAVSPAVATLDQHAACSSQFNKCHDNVARWLQLHPAHKAQRGWILSEADPEFGGGCTFDQHSVVAIGDQLIDVTPVRDGFQRRFLPFYGPETEFWQIPAQLVFVPGMPR